MRIGTGAAERRDTSSKYDSYINMAAQRDMLKGGGGGGPDNLNKYIKNMPSDSYQQL